MKRALSLDQQRSRQLAGLVEKISPKMIAISLFLLGLPLITGKMVKRQK